MLETLNFLTPVQARKIRAEFGSPIYVYDEGRLLQAADEVLQFPNAFGLTARYAMKANPNASILRLFADRGLHFDASSGFEADRAVRAGIPAEKISLSAQELPKEPSLLSLGTAGVRFVATSLEQMKVWSQTFPGSTVAVRFNPGVGSGANNRTNVGGPSASFGIWHEWLDDVVTIAANHDVTIDRIHTHIGSGSDPEVWKKVAKMSLALVGKIPTVTKLNLGGGYKVARMSTEKSTNLQSVGQPVADEFREFAKRTGREIHLEIEPGTYLLANCGTLLTAVQDIVSTGDAGHEFLRTDTGMSELLRPAMYGAQHPIVVIPAADRLPGKTAPFQVVGHCCESSDLMTTAAGNPEELAARELPRPEIGDLIAIEGCGAYCASMAASNYNSFPIVPEVLIESGGDVRLIRRRQTMDEILALEVSSHQGGS